MWWQTSNCSSQLIYRPREDERLSWPGWLTYSGQFTHISGHPSATGRVQDGERTLARDWRSTVEPCGPTDRCMVSRYVDEYISPQPGASALLLLELLFIKPMTDARETRMRNLHEIEHALFNARNSRQKYLAASQHDTRTSFSRKLTHTSFSYVCHGL